MRQEARLTRLSSGGGAGLPACAGRRRGPVWRQGSERGARVGEERGTYASQREEPARSTTVTCDLAKTVSRAGR